VGAWR